MKNSVKTMFYTRPARVTSSGLIPVFMRATINGARFERSVTYVNENQWSQASERVTGKTSEAKSINEYLTALEAKAFSIQKRFLLLDENITVQQFENEWDGAKERVPMLIEIFKDHNEKMKQLVGKEFSDATRKKYDTMLKHTQAFIKVAFNANDLPVKQIKYQTIVDFAFWLKTKKKCNHNSTIKYLTNFKKIINIALKNEWISKSPFVGYKMVHEESKRRYLTSDELRKITEKQFGIDRIEQVRDAFLFSCYTGLAYSDIRKLTRAELETRADGQTWVITSRQKTKNESRVPLLPPAMEILKRYIHHPACCQRNTVLPVMSNQKMNAYLKEIGDICGIEKILTTHVARHTFATTITLNKGVPMDSVSKMLGHKNLKETQRYAKVLDDKIGADMKKLIRQFPVPSSAVENWD